MANGHAEVNGMNGGDHKSSRHRETSEERRIRKEKERSARSNETEEERRIRKEKERGSRPKETEEERRIRKEKERDSGKEKRKETEEERNARKEKERKERDNRPKETEEERQIRKEKERKERDERHKKDDKRKETEEERAARKEKERKERKNETEEERRIRKEKERKERDGGKDRKKETEEERAARKERERAERKEKEKSSPSKREIKDEPGMELGDDYFAQEEARIEARRKVKQEEVKQEEMDEEEEEFKPVVKHEDSDEDMPLAKRKDTKKRKAQDDDESDDEPLSKKKAKSSKKKKDDYYEEEEDFKPAKKKPKIEKKPPPPSKNNSGSPQKKMTKKEKELEDEKKVWKWWEEQEQLPEGVKWRHLEHKGPMLAPDYDPLPSHVKFWYNGKVMKLSQDTEEAATFYGRMLDHDYTTKEIFNKNFFKDWRKLMTEKEKEVIRDLQKCDFSEINEHFKKVSEERKARSKEEKKAEKEKNEQIIAEMGFCVIDGHKERIGNFRIEPPGLFRGRGEHPKMGCIKRRTMPEDVTINCSKDSDVPQPPPGHKWKKIQHDNAVTWLASWTENVQGQIKYVMLNPSSKLKGEKDMMKYEKARQLKAKIGEIRSNYMDDMKSKEMRVRQRAVAMYFIDKLALRAGNEKDSDEQADTVGCCSLRYEHIQLHDERNGKECVVEFDFLGKDSIRYHNEVPVEKRVFKNLKLFMEQKKDGDDLFDRLNTSILNQHLNQLMDGLTAKVFRTYNASFTLQDQLKELTEPDDPVQAKLLSYNRANRAVAVLCNHQRAVPKTHDKSMENLDAKIEAKQDTIKEAQKKVKNAKKASKGGAGKAEYEKCKKTLERLLEQLDKLEIQKTDKDENKTIALGTSKLNYLDPRISVAWCKKHDVPIEKVYNKTQREKFRWAIDMTDEDYEF